MPLTGKQQGDLIRLFSDEGMVDSLTAIFEAEAASFRDRAFRHSYSAKPDITEIAQDASKAYAFESAMGLLREKFESIMADQEQG